MVVEKVTFCIVMASLLQQAYTSIKLRPFTYHLYYSTYIIRQSCVSFLAISFKHLCLIISEFVTVVTWKPYSCNKETKVFILLFICFLSVWNYLKAITT